MEQFIQDNLQCINGLFCWFELAIVSMIILVSCLRLSSLISQDEEKGNGE